MGFEEIPPKSPIAFPPASPSLARAVLTRAHQRSASRSSQTGSAPTGRPRSGSEMSGVLSTSTGGSPPTTSGLRPRSSSESEAARPASRPSSRASGSGRRGPPVVRGSEDEQS